jgi:ABC-type polysaccharide/polyol phosphate export permease
VLVVALQVWMWSVPVVYPEEILPATYRAVLALNPVYPFVRTVRELYLVGVVPAPLDWLALLGWVAVAAGLGSVVLRHFRAEVRDAL